MEKEFVSYEQAVALKELGFNEKCLSCYLYEVKTFTWELNYVISNNDVQWVISAPLKQQVFRWFRDKYELSCSIELTDNSRHYYFDFTIYDSKNRDYNDEDCFDLCKRIYDDGKFGTYEESENACIDKLIELAKQ